MACLRGRHKQSQHTKELTVSRRANQIIARTLALSAKDHPIAISGLRFLHPHAPSIRSASRLTRQWSRCLADFHREGICGEPNMS